MIVNRNDVYGGGLRLSRGEPQRTFLPSIHKKLLNWNKLKKYYYLPDYGGIVCWIGHRSLWHSLLWPQRISINGFTMHKQFWWKQIINVTFSLKNRCFDNLLAEKKRLKSLIKCDWTGIENRGTTQVTALEFQSFSFSLFLKSSTMELMQKFNIFRKESIPFRIQLLHTFQPQFYSFRHSEQAQKISQSKKDANCRSKALKSQQQKLKTVLYENFYAF